MCLDFRIWGWCWDLCAIWRWRRDIGTLFLTFTSRWSWWFTSTTSTEKPEEATAFFLFFWCSRIWLNRFCFRLFDCLDLRLRSRRNIRERHITWARTTWDFETLYLRIRRCLNLRSTFWWWWYISASFSWFCASGRCTSSRWCTSTSHIFHKP